MRAAPDLTVEFSGGVGAAANPLDIIVSCSVWRGGDAPKNLKTSGLWKSIWRLLW